MPTVRLSVYGASWPAPAGVASVALTWRAAVAALERGGSEVRSTLYSDSVQTTVWTVEDGDSIRLAGVRIGGYADIVYEDPATRRKGAATLAAGAPAAAASGRAFAAAARTGSAALEAGSPQLAASGGATRLRKAALALGAGAPSLAAAGRARITAVAEAAAGTPRLAATGRPRFEGVRFRVAPRLEAYAKAPPTPATAGSNWRRAAQSLSADRGLVAAAAIEHPDAPEPAYIVSAARDLVLGRRNWLGAPFTVRLANDEDDRPPQAQLSIFWAGRGMAALLEATGGGVGATVELSEWSFDPLDPLPVYEREWQLKFHVVGSNVAQLRHRDIPAGRRPQALNLILGVTPRADRPAVSARYIPETDPWVFA